MNQQSFIKFSGKENNNEILQWEENDIFCSDKNVLPLESYSLGLYQQDTSLINNFIHYSVIPKIETPLEDFNIFEFSESKFEMQPPPPKKFFELLEVYYSEDKVPPPMKHNSKRPNFSYETREILKQWLLMHADYPYPNRNDIIFLMEKTGLEKTKILTWMTNNRARLLGRAPKNGISNRSKHHVIIPMD